MTSWTVSVHTRMIFFAENKVDRFKQSTRLTQQMKGRQ